ncbi:ATP-dependent RNA helicase DbpA [Neptunomonas sp. XY-337]|uniref:ATP-dependent RNA helicase DbpA n=1 Tax=Neptunomonas sp. XY-337 TaxID=2561897 RepID=UPI0010A9FA13|nr:ATP-dependent RNA helicase DbpA [Neptunomonas sp. XY-337]
MNTSFASLPLRAELISNLSTLGYASMTPIQAQSLPQMLAGKDLIGQGKTGSGKTAAFGLGLLNNLNDKRFRIQTLVLCPTRELADQVAVEVRRLARGIHNIKVLTLCGGMPMGPQIGSLEHGAHIIVGTPGRIEDHLDKGRLDLSELNTLVLDEADRMLDMGFQDTLDRIVDQLPAQRQNLLFSATFPEQIQKIAERVLHNPVMVKVESLHEQSSISQSFYRVADDQARVAATHVLLAKHKPTSCIIFCNTKKETQQLCEYLSERRISAMAIHGDLEQKDRDQVLVRFASRSLSVLIATDVAARGLDIDDIDLVINYQVAFDPEVHTHRVGRTGRADSSGEACTLFSEKEAHRIAQLELPDGFDPVASPDVLPSSDLTSGFRLIPSMTTLQLAAGKKQKIRPGDILGALTGDKQLSAQQIGKIKVGSTWAYVSVANEIARDALDKLQNGKIKGRSVRVRRL